MVTEHDLDQARQALAAAERNLTEEQDFAGGQTSTRLSLAHQWHRDAQAELADLEARFAEQREAAERPAREVEAAPLIGQAGKALKASAGRVRAAVEAAQAALVELLDAAAGHDALAAACARDLMERRLTLDAGHEHQTGGKLRSSFGGGSAVVRLNGAWHMGVAPADVLAWAVGQVEAARLGRPRPFASRVLDGRADALLAGVAPVPVVEVPRLQIRTARPESAPVARRVRRAARSA